MEKALILAFIATLCSIIWVFFVGGPPQGYNRKPNFVIPSYSSFNKTADSFVKLETYLEKSHQGIRGPEAIIISQSGKMYTGSDGNLIQLHGDDSSTTLLHLNGRILGGAVTRDEKGLYICVPPIGLLYVDLEFLTVTIASSISDDGIPIRFPDDLKISSNNKVYFSDATTLAPWLNEEGSYDLLKTSIFDVLSGSGTGRLLEYDIKTKKTKTLIKDLSFANGVELSDQEDYVLVVETFGFRIKRYWLKGPRAYTYDIFVDNLPGFADNLSISPLGGYWIAIGSEVRYNSEVK